MTQNGIKSSLHDASPSWNGFNYQGKVGLNTALTKILSYLVIKPYDKQAFTNDFENISLEYEWLEDFSIKNGSNYESLHQVKNFKESNFSSYRGAIDTILTRRQGAISKSDLLNYLIIYEIDDPEKTSDQLIKDLIKQKIISPSNCPLHNWEKNLCNIAPALQEPIKSCLNDYAKLLKNAYSDKVPNYIHSANAISEPSKNLQDYTWSSKEIIPNSIDRTLDGYNIFFKQSPNCPYSLALNDTELNESILQKIKAIKEIISPEETTIINEKSFICYMAALLESVDEHVRIRHTNIKNGYSVGKFRRTVAPFQFTVIIDTLLRELRDQDTAYFAIRAEQIIAKTVLTIKEIIEEEIQNVLVLDEEKSILSKKLHNLLDYEKNIIKIMTPTELLSKIQQSSPHIKKTAPIDIYFSEILQISDFKNVFLDFIMSLSDVPKEFHPTCSNSLRYSPSCINVEHEIGSSERAYSKISQRITDACTNDSLVDSLIYNYHFIAIRTKQGESTNTLVEPPRVGNDYEDNEAKKLPKFGDKLSTRLISISDAANSINGVK